MNSNTLAFPSHRFPLLVSLIALGIATLADTAYAQSTVNKEQLDPVIVTAAGVGTDPLTTPASVTVITGQELEKGNFVDLTDALRNVPGVAVAGGAGAENIYLRGLPAEYTLILIDGKRLNSRAARTNGSGGVDQYFMPPASAIDRIEIVRGPMSSLYGSDAMGGVINIITKPSSGQWTGSLSVEATVPKHDEDSSERQQSFYLNGALIDNTLGLQVWGRHLDRSPSERIEIGRIVGQDKRDIEDINARMIWTPSFNNEFMFEVAKNDMETEASNETIIENPRRSASLGYDGQLGRWHVISSAYREEAEQSISRSRTNRKPEITTSILDTKASTDYAWHGAHELTLGSQWKEDELEDQNLGLGSTQQEAFSNVQWALFAEDIWALTPTFDLTTGARYTHDERFDGEVTPRVYGLWALS
ncbi:MAG: TonB-dependent receptor domain-containing protein, partial [Pseudomonadota bacterium]